MTESWTTSSVDLLLALEPGGRRAGLERAIRAAIADGRLVRGAKLPSSRALARDLGVARGTVIEAYGQLTAEGYLSSQHGSGTWVAAGSTVTNVLATPTTTGAPRHDLRPGSPDLSMFPRSAWMASARRALQAAPDAALGRPDPRGRIELRTALAGYLGRARGVRVDPERVVVCNGFVHALPLLCSALQSVGLKTLNMEDPCLPQYRQLARTTGIDVRAAPVDEGGVRVDFPADEHRNAVLVTPAHQFPLGVTLRPDRRAALAQWARESNGVIIEDDYDGEFRYDRQPAGALQGLAPEHTIYCGTASKTLAPALRLGWMVVPPSLLDAVVEAKVQTGQHSGVFDQLTLANFIASGSFDRHIRRARLEYRRRRDALVAALAVSVPAIVPTGIAAGLHVVIPLPGDGPSERQVLTAAAGRSVGIHTLGPCWESPAERPGGLIAGYATPAAHAFPAAVQALSGLLGSLFGDRSAD